MGEPVKNERKSWTLSVKVVDAIFTYLGSRPYLEVAHLIAEVGNELKAQEAASQASSVVPPALDPVLKDVNDQKS